MPAGDITYYAHWTPIEYTIVPKKTNDSLHIETEELKTIECEIKEEEKVHEMGSGENIAIIQNKEIDELKEVRTNDKSSNPLTGDNIMKQITTLGFSTIMLYMINKRKRRLSRTKVKGNGKI